MISLLSTLIAFALAALPVEIPFQRGDQMPDFSRVGYRWGDAEIPTVKVVKKLKPPKDGSDAAVLIQEAIDNLKKPGAILLTAGTYNLEGTIRINRSGVVLRGEGEDRTILVYKPRKPGNAIVMGAEGTQRELDDRHKARVTDDYVPFGALSLNVDNPWQFRVGDHVVIRRPGTREWIHDIKMDDIPQRFDRYGIVVRQWDYRKFTILWERVVTAIEGNRVWLDNPVVMALDSRYGGGELVRCSWERVSECGVEALQLVSDYNRERKAEVVTPWKKTESYCCDEMHGWRAIRVTAAEHCWVRNVTTRHFGFCNTQCAQGSRNITVSHCSCLQPVSLIHGSRRYAFHLSQGECCLFSDCNCDEDRHGCASSGRTPGPNVYTRCRMTRAYNDAGPHNQFSTGTLYDCLSTSGPLDVQDRGGTGHGHGWAGANMVFWNCEAGSIICQGLWASATNYCIGCMAEKRPGMYPRPDGVWVSHGKHVEPESLYDWQLARRKADGIAAVPPQLLK